MRLQAISLFFVLAAGCGGGSSDPIDPESVFVDELDNIDQAELCEDFLDDFCTAPGNTFCEDDCIDTACTPAADEGFITDECAPGDVTVGEVLDCGADATEDACGLPGTNSAGCVGDALVAACEAL